MAINSNNSRDQLYGVMGYKPHCRRSMIDDDDKFAIYFIFTAGFLRVHVLASSFLPSLFSAFTFSAVHFLLVVTIHYQCTRRPRWHRCYQTH